MMRPHGSVAYNRPQLAGRREVQEMRAAFWYTRKFIGVPASVFGLAEKGAAAFFRKASGLLTKAKFYLEGSS